MPGRQGDLGGLLLQHVDGQGHEHRSARRVLGDLERAAQERGHLVGALHLRAPLDERRRHRHEIVAEQGRAQAKARILLARGEEQGRARLARVVEHAERIAETGSHVQVHHARAPARLRIVARGADGHGLVQRQHVADLRVVRQALDDGALGGAGIAEEILDAVAHQGFHEDVSSAHAGLLSCRASGRGSPRQILTDAAQAGERPWPQRRRRIDPRPRRGAPA